MVKAQILIVEDDHDLREALVTTLELAKFQVREAASAEDALASLARAPVDMVVSDVNMPGMSGHELLAEVQRLVSGAAHDADYRVRPDQPRGVCHAIRCHRLSGQAV